MATVHSTLETIGFEPTLWCPAPRLSVLQLVWQQEEITSPAAYLDIYLDGQERPQSDPEATNMDNVRSRMASASLLGSSIPYIRSRYIKYTLRSLHIEEDV